MLRLGNSLIRYLQLWRKGPIPSPPPPLPLSPYNPPHAAGNKRKGDEIRQGDNNTQTSVSIPIQKYSHYNIVIQPVNEPFRVKRCARRERPKKLSSFVKERRGKRGCKGRSLIGCQFQLTWQQWPADQWEPGGGATARGGAGRGKSGVKFRSWNK